MTNNSGDLYCQCKTADVQRIFQCIWKRINMRTNGAQKLWLFAARPRLPRHRRQRITRVNGKELLGNLSGQKAAARFSNRHTTDHIISVREREHTAEAWRVALAERPVRAASERNVLVAELALLLDAGSSFVEGWALYRRYRWSGWLIVGATLYFLPVEAIAPARHFGVARVVLLVVNVIIVIYLIHCRFAVAQEPV